MQKQYTIREYMGFTRNGPPQKGMIPLPEPSFDQLEQFILSNRETLDGAEALELMSLRVRPGLGKVITARNYVGVIATRDGTEIEILPKLELTGDDSDAAIRRTFLTMLRTVQEIPFKAFRTAHLDTARMRLLELFIRIFLDEARRLVQRGLKSDYTPVQGNENCVKGKIIFPKHLQQNLFHRERVYIEYDTFRMNCPENRLLKSTSLYLQRHSTDLRNRKDIRFLLSALAQVPESKNIEQDFARCSQARTMADYQRLLELCRVFLQGRSFTAFTGDRSALALLFPMEQIFERYVASVLRKHLDPTQYQIQVQDRGKFLFDFPRKQFALRPDLVITDIKSGERTVLDTKWKCLSSQRHNYGISQTDMYQMYAYQREYGAKQAVLLYPMCAAMKGQEGPIEYSSQSGTLVKIQLMDLQSPHKMTENVKNIL